MQLSEQLGKASLFQSFVVKNGVSAWSLMMFFDFVHQNLCNSFEKLLSSF